MNGDLMIGEKGTDDLLMGNEAVALGASATPLNLESRSMRMNSLARKILLVLRRKIDPTDPEKRSASDGVRCHRCSSPGITAKPFSLG